MLIQAIPQSGGTNTEAARPLGVSPRLAPECVAVGGSHVVRLGDSRGPSTIARFVIPIGVDAIKRVPSAGPFADIGQEVREGVAPPITDGDPATAVVAVVETLRVEAPVFHVGPSAVLGRLVALPGESVRPRSSCVFRLQTSAGSTIASPKVVERDYADGGAVTDALDETVLCPTIIHVGQHDQPSVPFSDDINSFRHYNEYTSDIRRGVSVCR